MTAFRWYDCQWPWVYFKVIGLFHIKFLKNGVWYGKSYYWLLIGNHTLAFDWCHVWWPWSTFEGHFSLGCHFHVNFSNPWHVFASHGLAAIAELLVHSCCTCNCRKKSMNMNTIMIMKSYENWFIILTLDIQRTAAKTNVLAWLCGAVLFWTNCVTVWCTRSTPMCTLYRHNCNCVDVGYFVHQILSVLFLNKWEMGVISYKFIDTIFMNAFQLFILQTSVMKCRPPVDSVMLPVETYKYYLSVVYTVYCLYFLWFFFSFTLCIGYVHQFRKWFEGSFFNKKNVETSCSCSLLKLKIVRHQLISALSQTIRS